MLKEKPCKVISVTTSKTGKHGHAKANITGLDIFTGKKYIDICPTSHNMTAPVVTNTSWSLLGVEDGYLNLMDEDGTTKDDVKFPTGEIGEKLQSTMDSLPEDREIVLRIMAACGSEAVAGMETKDL